MASMAEDEVLVLEDGVEEHPDSQPGRGQPPRHKPQTFAESDDPDEAFERLMNGLGVDFDPDEPIAVDETDEAVDNLPNWEGIDDPFDEVTQAIDWDAELAGLMKGLEAEIRDPAAGPTVQPLQQEFTDALIRNRFAEGGEAAARQLAKPSTQDEADRIGAMLSADQTPVRRTEIGHLPLIEDTNRDKLDDVAAIHGAMDENAPKVELQRLPVAQPVPAILLSEADPLLAEDAFDDDAPVEEPEQIEPQQNAEPVDEAVEEPAEEKPPAAPRISLRAAPDAEEEQSDDVEADSEAEASNPLDDLETPDIALAEDPLYQASAPMAGDTGWVNKSGLRLGVDQGAKTSESRTGKKTKQKEDKPTKLKLSAPPAPPSENKKTLKLQAAQAKKLEKKQAKQAQIEAKTSAGAANQQAAKPGSRRAIGIVAACLVLAITGTALMVFQGQSPLTTVTAPTVEPTPAIPSLPPVPVENAAPAAPTPTPVSAPTAALPVEPVEEAAEPSLSIAELEALGNSRGQPETEVEAPAVAETPAEEAVETTVAVATPAPEATTPPPQTAEPAAERPAAAPAAPAPLETQEVAALPSPAVVPPQDTEVDPTTLRLAAPPPLPLPAELEALRDSAATGNRQAQHDLGAHFAAGRLVDQDFARAAYWFQEAAVRGVDNAQYNLGVLFQQGLGVPQNPGLAVQWYERAADNGHVEAKYNMGVAYADGIGVTRDIAQAVRWFEEAAGEGISRAAFNLGVMYEVGMIGSPDLAVARQWYRQAATSGEQDAINALERLDEAN